jgi:CubicO group peptidase (beta-lactamase class C family)
MRNHKLVLLVFAATSVILADGLAKVEPQEAGLSPERLQRLRRYVKDSVDRKEFAGINVAIARHGKLAYSESFGFLDLEAKKPMTADAIFRMASMTKPITSAAVMMLYEEGRFLLDEPVAKYIPEFAKVKVLAQEDGDGSQVVDLERPMTIRHLLTHTSGLSNAKGTRAAGVRGGTLREFVTKLATVPLAHQPGSAWRYGDSIDVLGYLVEVWSDKTFDVFLEERVFRPLGMKDTGFYVPADKTGRVAKVYRLTDRGDVEPSPQQSDPSRKPRMFSGSGGLYSTAGDYLRFCQMLLNGGQLDGKRLLSKATVDYMLRNHVPLSIIPPDGPNGRKGYGFGIGGAILMDAAAAETLSVDGEFNWGGANGTYFWIDRKSDVIGLWMVQRPPFVPPPSKRFKVLTYQALEN